MSATLREATFDDYPGIRELMQRYGLETKTSEEWTHAWKANPVLTKRVEPWPLGWALESQGRLVGFIGNIPTFFSLAGRRLLVTTASAWVVDEPYRSQSLGLVKRFFGQKEIDLFLNTTARIGSGKVFEALGAKRMPLSYYQEALVWITAPREVARSLLIKKNVPGSGALSWPVGLALRIWLELRSKRTRQNQGVRELTSFDSRFDAFWNELRQDSTQLLSWRDAETLNWHFRYPLAAKRAHILTLEANGRLRAYAVLYRQDNAELGLRRYRLADFQCLDDSAMEDAFGAVLQYSLELCRREGLHLLEAIGFAPQKRAVLERFSPLKRKLEAWPFYFKTRHAEIDAQLSTATAWDPSLYDGDGSL